MSINRGIAALLSAVALAGDLGLAGILDAHETKKSKKIVPEKSIPVELKTPGQWEIPSIDGLKPYYADKDPSTKVGKMPTTIEYYDVGGNIIIRNVLGGKTYVIFVCRAPPKSNVGFYFSPAGNGLFENLSPQDVSCNAGNYKIPNDLFFLQ